MGKVLLAFLPDDELDELLDGMELAERGPNTLTARGALRAELDPVRDAGLAVNDEELAYGLRSIAAPSAPVGRGRRRAQPRGPPLDGLADRADRALCAPRPADGRGDLRRGRLDGAAA